MSGGVDILLDPDTHDLDLSKGGDLRLTSGVEGVAQSVKQRLLAIRGEWFLDRQDGVPYFEEVFIKGPSLALLESRFRSAVLGTDGISSLTSFILDLDPRTRQLFLSWSAPDDETEVSSLVAVGV